MNARLSDVNESLFKQFIIEDLDTQICSAIQKLELMAQLINDGALDDLQNVNSILPPIQKYLARIFAKQAELNQSTKVLFRAIISKVDTSQLTDIPFPLKKLALISSLLLNDNAAFERIHKLPCQEEQQVINECIETLLTTTANAIPREDRNIRREAKNAIYKEIFSDIACVLENKRLCIDILTELEAKLAENYQQKGIKLTPYLTSSANYIAFNLPWPILDADAIKPHISTQQVLNQLLLNVERTHGINTAIDAPALFAGFVDEEAAKQHIREKNAFVEYNYIGNLLHGKYSHRLQWYIIFQAIQRGLIKTHGMSISDIFSESANTWFLVLDRYSVSYINGEDTAAFGFCSPLYLHSSIMLLKDKLPCLSGTLRKIFSRSLQILSAHQNHAISPARICAEYDIAGSAFNNLYPDVPFEAYFQAKQKHQQLKITHQGSGTYGTIFYKQRQANTAVLATAPYMVSTLG